MNKTFEEYLIDQAVKPLSRRQYICKVRQFQSLIPQGMTQDDKEELIEVCKRFSILNQRSIAVAKASMRHYLYWQGLKDVYDEFTATTGRRYKQPPRKLLSKSLSVQELQTLFSQLPSVAALMLKIEYECGAFRIAAITGMKLGNVSVDTTSGQTKIQMVDKGQKVFTRYLTESTAKELWTYIDAKGLVKKEDLLFGEWNYLRVEYELKKIADISTHFMRHSRATHLLEAGVDPYEVKEFMGHSDIRTTMTYAFNAGTRSKGILEKHTPSLVKAEHIPDSLDTEKYI